MRIKSKVLTIVLAMSFFPSITQAMVLKLQANYGIISSNTKNDIDSFGYTGTNTYGGVGYDIQALFGKSKLKYGIEYGSFKFYENDTQNFKTYYKPLMALVQYNIRSSVYFQFGTGYSTLVFDGPMLTSSTQKTVGKIGIGKVLEINNNINWDISMNYYAFEYYMPKTPASIFSINTGLSFVF